MGDQTLDCQVCFGFGFGFRVESFSSEFNSVKYFFDVFGDLFLPSGAEYTKIAIEAQDFL